MRRTTWPLPCCRSVADDRRRPCGRDLDGPVAAVVVVDVDRGAGQRLPEPRDRRADRRFLVVAGQQHGDARSRRHSGIYPLDAVYFRPSSSAQASSARPSWPAPSSAVLATALAGALAAGFASPAFRPAALAAAFAAGLAAGRILHRLGRLRLGCRLCYRDPWPAWQASARLRLAALALGLASTAALQAWRPSWPWPSSRAPERHVMAAARAVDMAFLALEVGFQLGAGRRPLADLGLREQEVDDLVLVERRAQLGGRHRLLLDVLDELFAVLAAGIARRPGRSAGSSPGWLISMPLAAPISPAAGRGGRAARRCRDIRRPRSRSRQARPSGRPHGSPRGAAARMMLSYSASTIDAGTGKSCSVGELVEQAALHVRAGQPVQFLLLLVA